MQSAQAVCVCVLWGSLGHWTSLSVLSGQGRGTILREGVGALGCGNLENAVSPAVLGLI